MYFYTLIISFLLDVNTMSGRPRKYNTDEERHEAIRACKRKHYHKTKDVRRDHYRLLAALKHYHVKKLRNTTNDDIKNHLSRYQVTKLMLVNYCDITYTGGNLGELLIWPCINGQISMTIPHEFRQGYNG